MSRNIEPALASVVIRHRVQKEIFEKKNSKEEFEMIDSSYGFL